MRAAICQPGERLPAFDRNKPARRRLYGKRGRKRRLYCLLAQLGDRTLCQTDAGGERRLADLVLLKIGGKLAHAGQYA